MANVPQHLRIVVDCENARPLPCRLPREGSEFVRAVRCGSPVLSGHRDRKGESRAEAQSVALGPYAAPVRFHYPLADGKAQTLSSDLRLSVRAIDP